jgi:hypothetical protein
VWIILWNNAKSVSKQNLFTPNQLDYFNLCALQGNLGRILPWISLKAFLHMMVQMRC